MSGTNHTARKTSSGRKKYPRCRLTTPKVGKPFVQIPRDALYRRGPLSDLPYNELILWCKLATAMPGDYSNRAHLCRWVGSDWNAVRKPIGKLQEKGLIRISEEEGYFNFEVIYPEFSVEEVEHPQPLDEKYRKKNGDLVVRHSRKKNPTPADFYADAWNDYVSIGRKDINPGAFTKEVLAVIDWAHDEYGVDKLHLVKSMGFSMEELDPYKLQNATPAYVFNPLYQQQWVYSLMDMDFPITAEELQRGIYKDSVPGVEPDEEPLF